MNRITLILLILLIAVLTPLYSQTGDWKILEKIDPLTDKKIISLSTESLEKQKFNYSVNSGTLFIRSDGGRISLFVDWGGFVTTDNTFVSYRFGEKPYKRDKWIPSTDNNSTFAYRPIETINLMLGETSAIIRTTPFGDNPVTYSFNIEGLEGLLVKHQSEFSSIFDPNELESFKLKKMYADVDNDSKKRMRESDKEVYKILLYSIFIVFVIIPIFSPYS